MTGHSKVDLTWRGKTYTIPANEVLMAVAMMEEVVTVNELCAMLAAEKPKSVLVSRAFAQLLRYAGAEVTDAEAYSAFVSEGVIGQGPLHALAMLVTIALPPDLVAKAKAAKEAAERAAGGSPKGKARRPRGGSSKRSMSSPAISSLSSRGSTSRRSSSGA